MYLQVLWAEYLFWVVLIVVTFRKVLMVRTQFERANERLFYYEHTGSVR
jgi:hypothetical protein